MSRERLTNWNQRLTAVKKTFLLPAFFTSIADFTRLVFFHPLSKNKKKPMQFRPSRSGSANSAGKEARVRGLHLPSRINTSIFVLNIILM